MRSGAKPRVLLSADTPAAADEVRQLLENAGCATAWQPLDAAAPDDLISYDLAVLESGSREADALHFCLRLRARMTDCFVPILFATANPAPGARLASLEAGADTYLLRPFTPGELLAQVRAFLRLKELHDRLTEKTAEVHRINKRLQQAYQQIDEELELARRIQRSFLPQTLPDMPPVRFAVCYRPCGRVGGDFYDVFRLDEEHLGFYVADAMGHGVPASLLTIFVKKGVRAKEIFGQQYRLLSPDEVLQRLNRELIEQALSEHPFITMVYALLNCRTGAFTFARAGHPHPLYVPRAGEPVLWQVHGTLLGVFETAFVVQRHQLLPGDKVVLYTDGVEPSADGAGGSERLLDSARRHRGLPVQEFTDRVAADLLGETARPDDFTLLALEVAAVP
jgi:sigma-B regulation protein RsbU (phosphoserine phosphatase)